MADFLHVWSCRGQLFEPLLNFAFRNPPASHYNRGAASDVGNIPQRIAVEEEQGDAHSLLYRACLRQDIEADRAALRVPDLRISKAVRPAAASACISRWIENPGTLNV